VLSEVEGAVRIERGGKQLAGAPELRLAAGDKMILGAKAVGVVRFGREKTWVRLTDGAQAELGLSPKRITLSAGSLSAAVAPQSARAPMILSTPGAQFTVVGTEFSLATQAGRTRLEVWRGKVRALRLGDGATAVAVQGEFVEVSPAGPLEPERMGTGLVREVWREVTTVAVNSLSELPCLSSNPTVTEAAPDFEMSRNWGDRFVVRERGYLRPPVSGWYQFWVAGDDRAELWLSRDERPEQKRRICRTTEWTAPQEWDRSPAQASARIYLEAGRKYYIEALQQELAGADSLSVAWRAAEGRQELVPGEHLTAFGLAERNR
jgi:hypothetical protein